MFKLDLEKAEEPEIKLPISRIIEKAREFQKNVYFCFTDYAKAFDCGKSSKLWKFLQEMGVPGYLTCFLRNLHAGQEATVWTRHRKMDWSIPHGCILSPCLFNLMQSTSWEMAGWMKHKLKSRFLDFRKYQQPQIRRWHHPYGRKRRGTKEPLDESEREEWQAGLKFNIQKTKIMASGPNIS